MNKFENENMRVVTDDSETSDTTEQVDKLEEDNMD